VLTILFELLREFQQYQTLIYGVLMISVILLLPNGLMALGSTRSESSAKTPPPIGGAKDAPGEDAAATPAIGRSS
jgi:hypothetical protein